MKREDVHEVFTKIPNFKTERLLLRPMQMMDAFDMYEYARLQTTTRYLLWSPHPDLEYTKNYLSFVLGKYRAGDFYDWAITRLSDGKMIGTCGFARIDPTNNLGEIGYVVNPAYHNQGYATEAVRQIIRFGFESLGFHRIEGKYMEGNDASFAVMKKCGLRFEGMAKESMFVKGKYRNICTAAILKSEYPKQT
ncbi:MAG: GNAT family N-acetyltransferase [Clostridia bacterium]|nr:GNAT family N-acetyltransferase [Clostridia bacterium]